MAAKANRLEVRLTSTQRRQIEQAAALAGQSVSSFVVLAALDRAEALVKERASTVLPASSFDQPLASLDTPEEAPGAARAAAAFGAWSDRRESGAEFVERVRSGTARRLRQTTE